ncbi:hypothetical protein FisN_5Hu011 [Fistulifera solaris]|uniref:Uncharacterized protein n=1 Tax=Fistulifera solaris TaxID=1519565 RepID=A0A1Z5JTL7_FISSO|nr:hypothetical protein FisN_5Hu011 [Fistulifera solaris]|eukprot:GAX17374.1 hypothetical protein FisN_5Hu011 [Fistulifera solaris]
MPRGINARHKYKKERMIMCCKLQQQNFLSIHLNLLPCQTTTNLSINPCLRRFQSPVACRSKSLFGAATKARRKRISYCAIPAILEDVRKLGQRAAIWRENQTLTYVSWGFDDGPGDAHNYLHCGFGKDDVHLCIVGSTHDAMAQTAAFFLSLVRATSNFSCLLIANDTDFSAIDLSAAQSQCFLDIFREIPSLHLEFQYISLSAVQSIVLATIPHPSRNDQAQ